MKSFGVLLGLVLVLFAAIARAETTTVGDFALLDQTGAFHQLSRMEAQKAVVIVVHGNGCPIVRLSLPALRDLRDRFADQGVKFLLLNANLQDTRADIRKEATEFGVDFPILKDESQLVAESLGVVRTSEAFVINPRTKAVVYRGPIDNRIGYESQAPPQPRPLSLEGRGENGGAERNYLADALAAHLAGKPIDTHVPEGKGCLVDFHNRKDDSHRVISYSNEVAAILESRCMTCHEQGGMAPLAFTNHGSVVGWSAMIEETLLTRRMPPGQIDEEVGQWSNVNTIAPREMSTLVHWIRSGAPKDGAIDPLAGHTAPAEGWRLGEPDLVLELPAHEVPATGTSVFKNVQIPLNIQEDKWVRAVAFRIGQREVMHHIRASIVSADAPLEEGRGRGRRAEMDEEEYNEPSGGARGPTGMAGFGYAPGMPVVMSPPDVGFKVSPGQAVRMQLHYFMNGKASVDRTKVGLYFYDKPPRYEAKNFSAGNGGLALPEDADLHAVTSERTVPVDSYLYALRPYMTFYGNSIAYTATFPDGRVQKLLNVPNYNFYWQMFYAPKEHVFLPAGTKITVEGVFSRNASSGLKLARDNFQSSMQIYTAK